jgi:hypothetical protein
MGIMARGFLIWYEKLCIILLKCIHTHTYTCVCVYIYICTYWFTHNLARLRWTLWREGSWFDTKSSAPQSEGKTQCVSTTGCKNRSYICIYIYIYIYIWFFVLVSIYTCMYVSVYVFTYTCMYTILCTTIRWKETVCFNYSM